MSRDSSSRGTAGPARAIRCACAVRDALRGLGIEVRAGLHTGEIELADTGVEGIAVHLGARIAALAEAGEVLVSSTVKDLVVGSRRLVSGCIIACSTISMELGLYTFAELTPNPTTGRTISPAKRLRNLIEEATLADEVGLDVFAIGEHHRPDFAVSAPAIALAAAAERTASIRLSSAVTVLSSDDPVRVFQQFATLDLLSGGRAEIMAGRGSFIESFPLFGYDLADYDELFTEKLGLLLRLRGGERVTWAGRHRAPLEDVGVYPMPVQDPIPVWIAVGGNPASAARAGALGLPMALAIIGGMPERFAPFAEIHRRAARETGQEIPALSINSHGFIADRSQEAADCSRPPFEAMMTRIGRERGWPPMGRDEFEASRSLRGANFVGSPQEVVEKILFQHEIFGHERFLIQLTVGSVDHERTMRAIELYGTEVAPAVREEVARRSGGRPGNPDEALAPTP